MKWIYKLIISVFISFIILNILTFVYYNVPPRVKDFDNVTEYKWPSNTFYSRFTEGIAFGFVNNDGYNNKLDYNKDTEINNLLMGSSHAEGFNISQNNNIASQLNSITDTYTYNIGISEHTLPICISNLDDALTKYQPSNYVIIETMNISFYDDQIIDAMNRNVDLEIYSNDYLDILQNFKYLKLVYYQLTNLKDNEQELGPLNDEQLLDQMLSYAKNICDKHKVKLIIVFHPTIQIDNNKEIHTSYDLNDLKVFSDKCEKNGIVFINMEEDFISYYKSENKLPHGFINTTPGTGHLNSIGHMLIANRLKKIVEE